MQTIFSFNIIHVNNFKDIIFKNLGVDFDKISKRENQFTKLVLNVG